MTRKTRQVTCSPSATWAEMVAPVPVVGWPDAPWQLQAASAGADGAAISRVKGPAPWTGKVVVPAPVSGCCTGG